MDVNLRDYFPPVNMIFLDNWKIVLFCQSIMVCMGNVSYSQPDSELMIDIWMDPDFMDIIAEQPESTTESCVFTPVVAVVLFAVSLCVFLTIVLTILRKTQWITRSIDEPSLFIVKAPLCMRKFKSHKEVVSPNDEDPQITAARELQTNLYLQLKTLHTNLMEDCVEVSRHGRGVGDRCQRQINLFKEMSSEIEKDEGAATQLRNDFVNMKTTTDKLLNEVSRSAKRREEELMMRLDRSRRRNLRHFMGRTLSIQGAVKNIKSRCENSMTHMTCILLPMLADIHHECNQYELLAANAMQTIQYFCDKWQAPGTVVHFTNQPRLDSKGQLDAKALKEQVCIVSGLCEESFRARQIIDEIRNIIQSRHVLYKQVKEKHQEARRSCLADLLEYNNIQKSLIEEDASFSQLCRDVILNKR